MKHLLLTFDYELFLGSKSGSVNNCLIKPTNLLLDILMKQDAKSIFFIDTTYLYRLSEEVSLNAAAKEDFELIIDQLKRILNEGHYLFHHLHPHWLDGTYLKGENQWDLSKNNRFSFNSISEVEREQLFAFSQRFLCDLYQLTGRNDFPDGYRAGGLFIEPFSNFKPFFEQYDIKHEFSVVPGQVKKGDQLQYDFTHALRQPFQFSENPSIVDSSGSFSQYPVTVISIAGMYKVWNGLYYRLFKHSKLKQFGDGSSVSATINSVESQRNLRSYLSLQLPVSVELLNPAVLQVCKKYLRTNNYFHFLSHPKLLTPQSLINLEQFLVYSKKCYTVNFDFKNIQVK